VFVVHEVDAQPWHEFFSLPYETVHLCAQLAGLNQKLNAFDLKLSEVTVGEQTEIKFGPGGPAGACGVEDDAVAEV